MRTLQVKGVKCKVKGEVGSQGGKGEGEGVGRGCFSTNEILKSPYVKI